MKKAKYNSSGVTLLELLTAIAITGIVIGLIFATYTNFTRGFYRQVNKAGQVRHMLLVKKQIDNGLADIAVVTSIGEKNIDYQSYKSNTPHSIRYNAGALAKDTAILAAGLSGFSCSLERDAIDSTRAVLVWEALIGNGWIGGGREVRAEW
jgi:Tfp pilus assembly protein PilE